MSTRAWTTEVARKVATEKTTCRRGRHVCRGARVVGLRIPHHRSRTRGAACFGVLLQPFHARLRWPRRALPVSSVCVVLCTRPHPVPKMDPFPEAPRVVLPERRPLEGRQSLQIYFPPGGVLYRRASDCFAAGFGPSVGCWTSVLSEGLVMSTSDVDWPHFRATQQHASWLLHGEGMSSSSQQAKAGFGLNFRRQIVQQVPPVKAFRSSAGPRHDRTSPGSSTTGTGCGARLFPPFRL